VREVAQDRRRRQPLDRHPDLADGLLRLDALCDQLAGSAVAADRRPAGDDEVAHARETREGLLLAPGGDREAGHLGESARDERRLRVVAERKAVRSAGGEPDHVLRGRAELDADHVVVAVDAEGDRGDLGLQVERELLVVARDHGRSGEIARDLVRDVRPGENGDRPAVDERR
jgi:hypothetical protein